MNGDLELVTSPNLDPDEALLATLRLDSAQTEAAVKVPITLQCRKPPKHEFIRVHSILELTVSAIELKDDADGGFYLVATAMAAALSDEAKPYVLRPYVNRGGVLRLWPIRLPDPDGRVMEWHRSAAVAASLAMRRWIRVTANRSLGAYEVFEAAAQPPDPEWPEMSLADMMRLAFTERGRVIQDQEHPVVKQLLGRL
jgi:hypothetical protein